MVFAEGAQACADNRETACCQTANEKEGSSTRIPQTNIDSTSENSLPMSYGRLAHLISVKHETEKKQYLSCLLLNESPI